MSASVLDLKISLPDSGTYNDVDWRDLEYYMVSKGWKPHGEMPYEWRSLQKRVKTGEAEILIPLNSSFLDYAARIRDAIVALAKFEGCSPARILSDLRVIPINVISRIYEEAKSVAKSGKTPSKVYLDPVTLWDFVKLPESQTGYKFQQVMAAKGPRAAIEKVFNGQVSGLKVVFDADHFHVE